jgi:hypothetical protein
LHLSVEADCIYNIGIEFEFDDGLGLNNCCTNGPLRVVVVSLGNSRIFRSHNLWGHLRLVPVGQIYEPVQIQLAISEKGISCLENDLHKPRGPQGPARGDSTTSTIS